MATNWTILVRDGMLMAHLKVYVPNFPNQPLKSKKIFKIEVVMPFQSQVIPICVPQKRCFFGTFLEKIFF